MRRRKGYVSPIPCSASPLSSMTWQSLSQVYSSIFLAFVKLGRSFPLSFSWTQIQRRYLRHRYTNAGTTVHVPSTLPCEKQEPKNNAFSFLPLLQQYITATPTPVLNHLKPYVFTGGQETQVAASQTWMGEQTVLIVQSKEKKICTCTSPKHHLISLAIHLCSKYC